MASSASSVTTSASGHSARIWSPRVRAGRSWPSPTDAVRIRTRGATTEARLRGGLRAARLRPEDEIPPGRAHAEAGVVVLEVVAHVQLVQPPPDPRLRTHVVQREVEHVVDEVAAVEPGREPPD